ncbi:LAMI_0D09846g1_1 [Lachancea mirantina]|uniref:LAMI_0D09846g1_1 n=1 Tax=Lachancea mirantina TaxID=1230905 RepID=A0A1G4JDU5_9SACH|nr:LAMI_0D09846g1_1 [Lachancea mirantina]
MTLSSTPKNRSNRFENDGISINGNKQHASGKKVRQFTTRSRSKSAASFKGLNKLRRVLTHDGTYEPEENYPRRSDSIKKSKSSDSLTRRRAISALSMTTLGKSRNTTGAAFNANNGTSGPSSPGVGLKPQRRHSVKSVLELREGEEMYDDQSTTDEEVEYFTDEEDGHEKETELRCNTRDEDERRSDERTVHEDLGSNEAADIDESSDTSSRQSSNKTLMNPQLSYKPPCNLLQENEDRIDQDQDEDTINNTDDIVTTTNSLRRDVRNEAEAYLQGLQDSNSFQSKNGSADNFIPSMILSQSTGVEKHFDPPSGTKSSSKIADYHLLNQVKSARKNMSFADASEKSDYNINGKLSHNNLGSGPTAGTSHSDARSNFSTSISSLTTHLEPQSMANNRAQYMPRSKAAAKPSMLTNSVVSSFSPNLSKGKAGDFLPNINNFSQFLQSEKGGAESRTQQKLWLQRENSIIDLSSQSSGLSSVFLASNIEVKKEFERISREYVNVRRFNNPLNDSLGRVAPKDRLGARRLNSLPGQEDNMSKFLHMANAKNAKPLLDLIEQNLGHEHDIHQVLSQIWNEETAKFNRDLDTGRDEKSNSYSNGAFPSLRRQGRSSLRNNGGSFPSPHQRMIGSAQPTTRAVNRRMENALNQQQKF